MIKIQSTYNSIGLTIPSRQFIGLCFVLLLGIKPMTDINILFTETKYELLENISLENSNENQNQGNDESENFLNLLFDHQMIYLKSFLSYFDKGLNFINTARDIQLRPPKIS